MYVRRAVSLARVAVTRPKSTMISPAAASAAGSADAEMGAAAAWQRAQMPFSRAKIGPFFQAMPALGNQYIEDVTVRSFLKRHLPSEVLKEVTPDLERFGQRVGSELFELALECDRNLPTLQQYNAWGKRVDNIITCDAWKQMKVAAAEEGLISIAYERKYAEFSRLYQMTKLYLYAPSSGLFSCPIAMTDGAAKSIEVLNGRNEGLLREPFEHLISRDPQQFWTSGQWMTERKGGSDVANGCQTLAAPQPDGSYRLYGYKWFTSATESEMTLTLARVVDENGAFTDGTRGLSMFYLPVRNEKGDLNNIEVQRLKDKLGTRQVPTAELLLDGATAYRISEEGRGVASIASMLTMTRMHNALASASGMRRAMALARDYATKRECFGKVIKDHSLHIKNLANMEVETRAATLLTFEMVRLLGLDDCGKMSDQQKDVFRLMVPVMKLYTAKQAVAVASEGLECFGGAGYLEDTGLPLLLRDAQVLPIWEGTTNILSLDVLRALAKTKGVALRSLHTDIHQRATPVESHGDLKDSAMKVKAAADRFAGFAAQHPDKLEMAGREFAYSLARTYMGMLLVEHAAWEGATEQDVMVANRWCEQDLTPVITQAGSGRYEDGAGAREFSLVFDAYSPTPSSKL